MEVNLGRVSLERWLGDSVTRLPDGAIPGVLLSVNTKDSGY